ncbi:flagellin [Marinobacter litoralis]|uniref:flagellin N-terminal helical domain-containing protein n=1 Tax=Marinobacter litoralis TaxID=187981 RepID=UPI0018EB8D6F|nr:flagellin [Marinobacter litoralis]MBJ6137374.1 flagellin FliC [Marinobacter litoralis]
MALGINTNIASLNAQNQLSKSQNMSNQAMERLASGLRINSAKDDAAGLAVSTRFDTQIRGLNQAIRNAGDGISMVQTAEGGLDQSVENLQRIRELAVQAANGSLSNDDRLLLQKEVEQRVAEIDRIKDDTKFNGISVLNGTSAANTTIQVGADQNQKITIAAFGTSMGISNLGTASKVSDVTVSTAAGASAALAIIDGALSTVNTVRADLGAVQNRFESTISNLQTNVENQSASQSRILDADFAAETAKMAKANVLQQAGISVLAQANARPNQVLSLLQ